MHKKITLIGPSHELHRIIVDSSDTVHYHKVYAGGTIALSNMLKKVLRSGETQQLDQSKDNSRPMKEWPRRFLFLELHNPTPKQRKILPDKRYFLRVKARKDMHGIDSNQIEQFSIQAEEIRNSIVLLRGGELNHTPEIKSERPEFTSVFKDPVSTVVLAANNFNDNITHAADVLRMCQGNGQMKPLIICQMELGNLAHSFPIQTNTSYERTIGDICRAYNVDGSRQTLLDYCSYNSSTTAKTQPEAKPFDYFVIRIGNSGIVVIEGGRDAQCSVSLIHHAHRAAPTRSPGLGDMLGYDLILSTCLLNALAKLKDISKKEDVKNALTTACKIAIAASYDSFQYGFTSRLHKDSIIARGLKSLDDKEIQELDDPDDLLLGYIDDALNKKDPIVNELNVHLQTAQTPNQFWRMTLAKAAKSTVAWDEASLSKEVATKHLLAKKGKIDIVPVEIGDLKLVDRHEVEDYLFLQNLLLSYQSEAARRVPLSIGVFGQPGAGKSYGVNQLILEMSGDGRSFAKETLTLNLSQVKTLDELFGFFHAIRDKCLSTPIPLVFFDEFDATFEGQQFGWLKYFLAPMQDGAFTASGKNYHFGKAIFVFAGGINHNFAEFNGRSRNAGFTEAKGPDFISRLRGILNIRGINKPEGDDSPGIYMVRRAFLLRKKLEELIGKLNPKEDLISKNLIEAFLNIPQFKHGVRSMNAILEMSSIVRGQPYTEAQLPPRDQLDMHVDARTFHKLVGFNSSKANS